MSGLFTKRSEMLFFEERKWAAPGSRARSFVDSSSPDNDVLQETAHCSAWGQESELQCLQEGALQA